MDHLWLTVEVLVKAVFFLLMFALGLAGVLTWVERKQSALIQDRIGPNRANIGPFRLYGLVHFAADGIKMIMKEDFMPANASRGLFQFAPLIAFVPVLVAVAAVPFGGTLIVGDRHIPLQIIGLDAGILFVLAIGSLATYGPVLAGYASDSKLALMGAMRASAQLISYEVALGLSLVGVMMHFGTADLDRIVAGQQQLLFGWLPAWGAFVQPLGFVLFLVAGVAETKRTPFDLPEGESEIIGYFVEYSGMKFGMFMFGEFLEIVLLAMLTTTFFLGGYGVPWLTDAGFAFPWGSKIGLPNLAVAGLQVASFSAKVGLLCFLQLAVRWSLPRVRYDQLMALGWKVLLPLALANIAATGIVLLL